MLLYHDVIVIYTIFRSLDSLCSFSIIYYIILKVGENFVHVSRDNLFKNSRLLSLPHFLISSQPLSLSWIFANEKRGNFFTRKLEMNNRFTEGRYLLVVGCLVGIVSGTHKNMRALSKRAFEISIFSSRIMRIFFISSRCSSMIGKRKKEIKTWKKNFSSSSDLNWILNKRVSK